MEQQQNQNSLKVYKQSEILEAGQLTEHLGIIYRAANRIQGVPCFKQCHARIDGERCFGLCYRFVNGDHIVLQREPVGETEIIETEYARACREYKEQNPVKPRKHGEEQPEEAEEAEEEENNILFTEAPSPTE